MSVLRALILDFDGVIIESNDLKTQAFAAVFTGFPDAFEPMMAYHHAHMPESRFVKFRHLATAHLGLPANDPIVDRLGEAFSAEMLRLVDNCPMVAGAEEFLSRAGAAVPLYLASVTPQAELETILERRRLLSHFSGVYGCPPWTKAEALQDITRGLNGTAGVLFVGDSSGDQRAAAAAAVEFLARDSGLPFDVPLPRRCGDMHEVLAAIADRLPAVDDDVQ